MVLTQKMIWEPLNFGTFLEKFYMGLNENGHNISIKMVYQRIYAFKTRGTSHFISTGCAQDSTDFPTELWPLIQEVIV